MDFVSQFLQAALIAAVPVVVPVVVAWGVAKTRESWAAVKKEKPQIADALSNAAKIAATAAEQANLSGFIDDKKMYALDVAEKWLAAQKISVDIKLVDAAIEAAVYQEFNKATSSE